MPFSATNRLSVSTRLESRNILVVFVLNSLKQTVRYFQFDDRTLQKESSATGAVKTLRNQNKKKKASEPDDATNPLPALHQCPEKTNCKVALLIARSL